MAVAKKLPTPDPLKPNPRHQSVNSLAMLLGRDRGTITRWLEKKSDPCPCVIKANKAAGIDWKLDVSDVVEWLERQAAKKAAEEFDTGDGTDGTIDGHKEMVALARLQLRLEEDQRSLVRQAYAVQTLRRILALIRQAQKGVPTRFMDLIPGIAKEDYDRIYGKALDIVHDTTTDAEKLIVEFAAETSGIAAPEDDDE